MTKILSWLMVIRTVEPRFDNRGVPQANNHHALSTVYASTQEN
jgi:hypothetical protein